MCRGWAPSTTFATRSRPRWTLMMARPGSTSLRRTIRSCWRTSACSLGCSTRRRRCRPMQIAARINQDQTISKDLTLWNQQGSQVLRTQTLVLPVGNTFLYIDPIYIQATEARMPQLKKVVLAMGNRLVYADTYDQALAQLTGGAKELITQANTTTTKSAPGGPPPTGDAR